VKRVVINSEQKNPKPPPLSPGPRGLDSLPKCLIELKSGESKEATLMGIDKDFVTTKSEKIPRSQAAVIQILQ